MSSMILEAIGAPNIGLNRAGISMPGRFNDARYALARFSAADATKLAHSECPEAFRHRGRPS